MGSKSSSSQVMTCRGVVCWGAEEEWRVEEIQVDPPKGSEVRMKMLFASICHSDILCSQGFPFRLYPRVLGHEGVGIVESVGEEVEELKEGDVVIPAYIGECRECENCHSERTNLCLRYPLSLNGMLPDGTSRMSIRGQTLYHLLSCSTWSEYTVSDANYVVKVDPGVALPHASFLSCGFSTGFGAAWMDSKVESGSSVAVIGLGAVGLGAIGGAREQGATTIIGVDKNGMKKDKGEAFGMTHFINPDDHKSSDSADLKSISEMVKDLTGGVGVDYCFECTGVSDLVHQALEATKVGKGKAVVVGAGLKPLVQINLLDLLMGRTLKGTVFGGLKSKTHLPLLLHKSKNKEIQLDELLTHEMKLEDVPRAHEILKRSDCVKILIKI
ncbi:CYP enzymes assisting alcohol dehydrogenase-like [Syzygium oleosum]|uniref:CYP enzymes assisting alcohol dehydrogenase-like n=1 Tax=Syzygium oleosum TaxID=219896 RepID=UPI0011D1F609|nr:CYP enzymes assisting alcohol dehydrogenase-like [Syzygium oleosum]XP_056171541.1 CYP enzymes assisting alcohol dehydrogenase-like [Syzygium oleosum]XP_056171542.1 CYP enzymes assisting alcohol dehydrogenase-like [Syzygium oleosum]